MHKITEFNSGVTKILRGVKRHASSMIQRTFSKRNVCVLSVSIAFFSLALPSTVRAGVRTDAEAFSARLGTGNNFMANKVRQGDAAAEDSALLALHNFNHCRIGSKLNDYTGSAPDYTVEATQMAYFKQAIDWCLAEGLIAIVNPVHDWAGSEIDPYADTEAAKYIKIWQQVASEFAGYPLDTVAFELLNEPRTGYSLADIIGNGLLTIRNVAGNEQRIVIVSGQGFSTRQALINALDGNIIPANDNYLIGTFHFYDPKTFTKQGGSGNINWADSGDADTEFEATASAFDAVVQANQNWAMVNNTDPLPIFLGEYGVDNGAPSADRLRWLSWTHLMAEERGFSTSHWNMYNDIATAKGIGPWTTLEKEDPSMRYFHADPVEAIQMRYEAEGGILSGGVTIDSTVAGYTGSGYVSYPGNIGSSVSASIDSVYIPRGDTYAVKVSYASDIDRDMTINTLDDMGVVVQSKTVTFPSTGSFSVWGELEINIDFSAGTAAAVQFVANTVSGPNIDWVDVTRALISSENNLHLFTAVADASAKQDAPTTNLGTQTYLQVRQEGASNFGRIAYLKFDVDSLPEAINSATLYVYSKTEINTVNALAIADNSWTENTLNWDNRPVVGSLIGSAQASVENWFTIDVSSYVTDTGTYSFALDELGNSYHMLGSKEGGFAAYLEITTEVAINNLPLFTSDPVIEVNATEGVLYNESVADNATDADGDTLTYLIVTGPEWLSVASNGTLSGTPREEDVGDNSWSLVVEDSMGGSSSAMLNIHVDAASSDPIDIFYDDFENDNLNDIWVKSGNVLTKSVSAFSGAFGVMVKNTSSLEKSVSTVGYTDITISYDRKVTNYDSGENLVVEWSSDGSNWNTLEVTADTSWANKSWLLPIEAEEQADFTIRFVTNANRNNEKSDIDNVSIIGY